MIIHELKVTYLINMILFLKNKLKSKMAMRSHFFRNGVRREEMTPLIVDYVMDNYGEVSSNAQIS
jgi:hypothetical protein